MIFMCALIFMGVWLYGWRSLMICIISVVFCVAADMICYGILKEKYNPFDFTAITYGLVLSLMMPPTVHPGLSVFAGVAAVVIGKHIFGGKDNYIFSPTAFAFSLITICFPNIFSMYPKLPVNLPFSGDITYTAAASLDSLLRKGASPNLKIMDIFLGKFSGGIGTTHILVLVIIAICLLLIRSISFLTTISFVGGFSFLAYTFPRIGNQTESILYEFISGYVLFGLIFILGDPQIQPKNKLSKIIYGLLTALLTVIIRHFAKVECGFCFAVLLVNIFTDQLDVLTSSFVNSFKNSLISFEKARIEIQRGVNIKLSDTQEIVIPEEMLPPKAEHQTLPVDMDSVLNETDDDMKIVKDSFAADDIKIADLKQDDEDIKIANFDSSNINDKSI